ncbi:endonuclease [Virgibacillus phasianinus]|uniref:Endonuclease n=1 Tax=Virgibacillus phasianinus TaxID=2017483 RepID=A0A220TZS6_9BACI|nr:Uma2 family endonuclease [Virgibacillus phasianinus]ASK61161.1 endonuclease [Virgibacillus phasianinus]
MTLPEEKKVSLSEFYHLREKTDKQMEYIGGVVFMAPSPSIAHQRISGRLHAQLFNLLEDKDCEVFHAPLDVEFSEGDGEEKKIVIPDLTVICDREGLENNKYSGAPTIIIEIISPSNQSHDLVTKLNLYMQYGVKEYWIVNPLLNTVQVYSLNDEGNYQQSDIAKNVGTVQSKVLAAFVVEVEKLFR